jgi:hypothetical protein
MASVAPPHAVLSPPLLPFEVPEDTTRFADLDESEAELDRNDATKVVFALKGKVPPDPYPFTFSSGTFSLGSFFRSYNPTAYTGIGIHRDHPAVYEHVLAANRLVRSINETMIKAASLSSRASAEDVKRLLRTLTTAVLDNLVDLRRLTAGVDPQVGDVIGDFPLTIRNEGLKWALMGAWEEVWAVAYQTSGDDKVAYSNAALLSAAAAVVYYRRAQGSGRLRVDCLKTAEARLRAVLIGWITSRTPEAQRQRRTGADEIPWQRDSAHLSMPGFKYSALCLVSLEPFTTGRHRPPSPRYASAYRSAAMYVSNAYGIVGPPKSLSVDSISRIVSVAEAWIESGDAGVLGTVAHPASSATEIWASPMVPERVAHLLSPGTR